MPYRRLPNTDAARMRALQNAVDKCGKMPPGERAFSQELFLNAKYFLTTLRSGITRSRSSRTLSVQNGANFNQLHKKMKMYLTHFVQVLNMSIARGETAASVRDFYGLDGRKLPKLESVDDLVEWGKRLIDGENERRKAGAGEMANPRIGNVKIIYESYVAAARKNDLRLTQDAHTSEYVDELRQRSDELIVSIWNEIEDYFSNLESEEKRQACAEYGISYVFRKSELARQNSAGEAEETSNE